VRGDRSGRHPNHVTRPSLRPLLTDLLNTPLDDLIAEARALRRGPLVTYSPKVFIPLTMLCRDVCGYCTFARPPRRGERAFLSEDEVLEIARAGAEAGCTEVIHPGGSKGDEEVLAAAEAHGMAVVLTGTRHFRH